MNGLPNRKWDMLKKEKKKKKKKGACPLDKR